MKRLFPPSRFLLDPFWEPKPSGIQTEATLVKQGREWKISGLPSVVAR